MDFPQPISSNPSIRWVSSFEELQTTPFQGSVNALCWQRELKGDFEEVVRCLGAREGILALDEALLRGLPLSESGRLAVEMMVEDLQRLRDLGRGPELNCIHAYPRDDEPIGVRTDVYSFHADSATVEADTFLCTYHGAPSEGIRNEEVIRHVDEPKIRAELLELYGGEDGEGFLEFLSENCFDLHYAPLPGAKPYSFGLANLWRIAVQYPGCEVPPCVHRAPETAPGDTARLLLIS
ncbi:hypothetical protein [Prosthecobacter dejongeii]|uniref:DUF1826 domain-containing protein n=1 Tax=Prosthecobacter dejongeii TaxID=48465 RepID=A0A7W7YL41_9BACT|nr:hypothetical protein [Prosthecobacter dejongeii]MBB5037950.1 hypothetical protein [Prosthecobacter dejongeii]